MGYFIQVSVLAPYREKRQKLKQRHVLNIFIPYRLSFNELRVDLTQILFIHLESLLLNLLIIYNKKVAFMYMMF